jgi:hypothetical protein
MWSINAEGLVNALDPVDHVSVFIIVSFLIAIYASVMVVDDSLNNTTEWDWHQGWRVPSAV